MRSLEVYRNRSRCTSESDILKYTYLPTCQSNALLADTNCSHGFIQWPIWLAKTSAQDNQVLSFSLHLSAATQNVTEVYEVGVLASVAVLMMEKAETSLSSVLCDIRQLATTRERVDLHAWHCLCRRIFPRSPESGTRFDLQWH